MSVAVMVSELERILAIKVEAEARILEAIAALKAQAAVARAEIDGLEGAARMLRGVLDSAGGEPDAPPIVTTPPRSPAAAPSPVATPVRSTTTPPAPAPRDAAHPQQPTSVPVPPEPTSVPVPPEPHDTPHEPPSQRARRDGGRT